ncbi:hypothetical protein HYALB_00002505 [Hymenoscyphus albidus]|uniref:Glutathione S-transferase n=1 Tax=Hymenoscyphus albidus TaxID=595503 RepID=A0A9N9Q8V7_9HELO|nr:hypothetical protein HYALB_00002505 [Hymenoscyphus albidus]
MTLEVHHLQVSQSERLPWLCEELGISYELVLHQRAPLLAPKAIKDLSPIGQAPIIQDEDLTLFESAACMEFIIHKYGKGRLVLPPTHKDYASYLFWFHFTNGTLQPHLGLQLMLSITAPSNPQTSSMVARLQDLLKLIDERLQKNTWLAGEDFTAADVMIVFSLTTMRTFVGFELKGFEGILGYLERVRAREGFKRARGKADPDLEWMGGAEKPASIFESLKREGKI